MPLSSIIDRAIEVNTLDGVTKQFAAKTAAKALIATDTEAAQEAIDYAVSKLIHDRATRAMRSRTAGDPRQGSFFGNRLRDRYAVDSESRIIKDTDRLLRFEWRAILNLREKQYEDDGWHLKAMREADHALSPIWDRHPDKTFGEVERIYLSMQRASVA